MILSDFSMTTGKNLMAQGDYQEAVALYKDGKYYSAYEAFSLIPQDSFRSRREVCLCKFGCRKVYHSARAIAKSGMVAQIEPEYSQDNRRQGFSF